MCLCLMLHAVVFSLQIEKRILCEQNIEIFTEMIANVWNEVSHSVTKRMKRYSVELIFSEFSFYAGLVPDIYW